MRTPSRSAVTAMLCAAAVTAQFVSAKATRDALFLTSVDLSALPMMLIATSVCSMLLVAANARLAGKIASSTLVPASFIASGLLYLAEWIVRSRMPAATAVMLYLHISSAGPLLGSGFWLIASERFDPHTAKTRFGQIAGAGTLGGLIGALLAERVAAMLGAPAMLVFLAGLQFLTAWLISLLARPTGASSAKPVLLEAVPPLPRSGLRVVAEAPHLRQLVVLVLLGTTSAALVEYLFKAKAVQTLGTGDNLLQFFALYYAGTSLLTFVLQVATGRAVLERFGLTLTTSAPSIALLGGTIASVVAPGFGSLLFARAGESIFRGSWFRAGYELFYTPMPAAEKRAAKSVVDVAVDRLGDAAGGGLIRLAVLLAPVLHPSAILSMAIVCSAGAVIAASRLSHWYVRTLERSLVNQAGTVDLSDRDDDSTQQVLLRMRAMSTGNATRGSEATNPETIRSLSVDPEVQDILALRSRNRRRVIEVLSRPEGLPAGLVPHAVALLAWDPAADHAFVALRKVAEERIGELTDALIDPNQDFTVRRRLARVFSVCVSQRAADGLMFVLDDARFDVRFQAARSLVSILDRNPRIRVNRERIFEVVLEEVAVGRPVWESHRLLDGFVSASPLDEFVHDRAGQSLAHVFTLLSLVLPREPLQIAFRSLHSQNRYLRGTALEYLEEVLPTPIRQRLWPFLVEAPARRPAAQAHDQIIANLLRSSQSITLQGIARGA